MPLALLVWIALSLGSGARAAPTEPERNAEDPRSTGAGPTIAGLVLPEGLVVWEAHPGRDDVGALIRPAIDPGWCPECPVSHPADDLPDLDTRFVAPLHTRVVTALLAGVLATRGDLDLDQTLAEALDVDVDPSLAEARVIDLVGGVFEVRTPPRMLAMDRSRCCLPMDRLRRPGAHQDPPIAARLRVARAVAQRPPPRPDRRHGGATFSDTTHPDALNPVLLAAVMERRTHQSWESLVEALVLDPLGLGPLRLGPDPEGPAPLVWRIAFPLPIVSKGRFVEVRRDLGALRPAGGLQASSRELIAIAQELMGPRLPIDPAIRGRLLRGDAAHPGLLARSVGRLRTSYVGLAELEGSWDRIVWTGAETDAAEDDAVIFGVGAGFLDMIAGGALHHMSAEAVQRTAPARAP